MTLLTPHTAVRRGQALWLSTVVEPLVDHCVGSRNSASTHRHDDDEFNGCNITWYEGSFGQRVIRMRVLKPISWRADSQAVVTRGKVWVDLCQSYRSA